MISIVSKSGKKARAPMWWLRFGESLPKFSIPALRPKKWTEKNANFWISLIPAKCPFERQLWAGNTLILYIPPLCALNPLSKQLYALKLEAQTYLYDKNMI